MASPDGQQYGPTVPTLFSQWITEGRVQPDWLVWRTGWDDWKTAAEAGEELPTPLQSAPEEPPRPPALRSTPSRQSAESISAPTATNQAHTQPEPDRYTTRRRRAAQRRRLVAIVLGMAVVVMLGVLAWLILAPPQS